MGLPGSPGSDFPTVAAGLGIDVLMFSGLPSVQIKFIAVFVGVALEQTHVWVWF